MSVADKKSGNGFSDTVNGDQWPGIDSRYRLIVVAAQRNKQLIRGALPRIEADPLKRRSTSIALEEAKRGLVPFTTTTDEEARKTDGQEPEQKGFDEHN